MKNQFESAPQKKKVPKRTPEGLILERDTTIDMTPSETGEWSVAKNALKPIKKETLLERIEREYEERPSDSVEQFGNGISVVKPIFYNERRNNFMHMAIERLKTKEEIQELFHQWVARRETDGYKDAKTYIAWCFTDFVDARHSEEVQKRWEDAIPGLEADIARQNKDQEENLEERRRRARRF